jgi:hypothetical protein
LELRDDVAWTAADDTVDAFELLQVKLHGTAVASDLGPESVSAVLARKPRRHRP